MLSICGLFLGEDEHYPKTSSMFNNALPFLETHFSVGVKFPCTKSAAQLAMLLGHACPAVHQRYAEARDCSGREDGQHHQATCRGSAQEAGGDTIQGLARCCA